MRASLERPAAKIQVRAQVSRARSPEGACGVFSRSARLEPNMLFADIAVLGILEPSLIRNAARQDIRLGGIVLFVRQPFSKRKGPGLLIANEPSLKFFMRSLWPEV